MKRRGIFLAEALVGTMLVLTMLGVIVITVSGQRRVAIKLAAERDAVGRTEGALLALQTRQPATPGVQERLLPTTAPSGWRWAEVTSDHIMLTGLVRAGEVKP